MSTSAARAVRTRFAPSPTGFLHLGGARTALFAWAYARHFKGSFILRIEDTDLERSTPEAVQAILDGMAWLDLEHDEGPFYQMQRMDRYREVIASMLEQGTAYYCYSSPEEVEAMRERARAAGLKPRYDGTWRPEPGKRLPAVPQDRKPVVRFKNPLDGEVVWDDLVKGTVRFANSELDDLVIARPDGTPTYNFCVVVDDADMQITHVIRGDDHVNNTPRQINILRALGVQPPVYGHVPMILGPDGDKLSKRHGAVSVIQYDAMGYLPEAMINYLSRLGWSHGDDELFDRDQLVAWFDGGSLSRSASQWDPKKLNWVNAQHLRRLDLADLSARVWPRLQRRVTKLQADPKPPAALPEVLALLRERAETLEQLADEAMLFFAPFDPKTDLDAGLREQHLTPAAIELLRGFALQLDALSDWSTPAIAALIKAYLAERGVKMPALGIPLRVALTGRTQTPAVDALLTLLGRSVALERLQNLGPGA